MMRWSATFLLCLFPLGCSVAEVEPPADSTAINRCSSSADCNNYPCSEGTCVAATTELNDLVIAVIRPTTLFGSSGLTFYKTFSDLPERGGRLDLDVPAPATVNGRAMMVIDPAECQPKFVGATPDEVLFPAADGSIPVDAVFTPSERLLGIDTPTYSTRFEVSNGGNGAPEGSYVFPISVPPGNYDVYLKPRNRPPPPPPEDQPAGEREVACPVPPLLLVNQPVSAGGQLDVILPQPQSLTVTVRWPENNIKDSVVDVLDPVSGRVISTASLLPEPSLSQPMSSVGFVSSVVVSYQPVYSLGADGKFKPTDSFGTEIVRLTPTEEKVSDRPVILAARDPTNAQGELLQTAALPSDVIVEGLTLIKGETTPVEAAVTLTAQQLDGFDPGVLASFTRTEQVDANDQGKFSLKVPPGRYRVDAVPKAASAGCNERKLVPEAPCLASVQTTWEISRQTTLGMAGMGSLVQGGKVVEFVRASTTSGRALSPLGPISGASVRASISPSSVQTELWDRVRGKPALLPRAGAALVNEDGTFSFLADAGTYDLFVQPDVATGFGWHVRPMLEVGTEDLDLKDLRVPLPVVYQGFVTSTSGTYTESNTVPDALIRAYTYVPDLENPEQRAAIQVAETRADRNGAFKLLIPARLDSSGAPTR